ncbi:putative holin [Marinobacterium sedimentorum]|uniref:putative holin n=1 Tax=Marinobacterium sedimentorum TaxID=2927804 RepID=UPI0020C685A4|nr:putative holin [Marinobacterium sedimentorum]MCP8687762.1 phage holin family protein [Marinobacterium sedimentorum]
MAEPSTTAVTVVATTGIGLASMFPGIDGNALIGAFAGATLFVMSARELSLAVRAIYLLISLIMGYIAAPELISHLPIQETGVAGFLAGLLCITLTSPLVKRLEGVDLITVIRGKIK